MTNDFSSTRARRTTPRLAAWGAILSALLATSVLRAQEGGYCSNATMRGTYVMAGTGTLFPQGGAPILIGLVGKVVYDGQGNGQVIQTASVGGVIYRQGTFTGTYSVNSDCTGSKTFTSSTGQASHFDFVITPDGRTITWIVTDAGQVLTGSAVRLDNRD